VRRHANDRLVCSPYYPPHDRRVALIKGRCVDNAVRLDGCQRRCAQQPEVQSKVYLLGDPTAMTVESAVQAEHRLNLVRSRETNRKNGYENRLPVFSYGRSPSAKHWNYYFDAFHSFHNYPYNTCNQNEY